MRSDTDGELSLGAGIRHSGAARAEALHKVSAEQLGLEFSLSKWVERQVG